MFIIINFVGGTESLMLAVLAYRGYGLARRGITKPNIVIPVTGHVALDKVKIND
jgi:sphinganine-1-phosphate aldolase